MSKLHASPIKGEGRNDKSSTFSPRAGVDMFKLQFPSPGGRGQRGGGSFEKVIKIMEQYSGNGENQWNQ
jgi:hypothetical protein